MHIYEVLVIVGVTLLKVTFNFLLIINTQFKIKISNSVKYSHFSGVIKKP